MKHAIQQAQTPQVLGAMMAYQHHDWQGQTIPLPVGKVVCIGQNYQDHIQEMNSKTAPQALFFIKPATVYIKRVIPVKLVPAKAGSGNPEWSRMPDQVRHDH